MGVRCQSRYSGTKKHPFGKKFYDHLYRFFFDFQQLCRMLEGCLRAHLSSSSCQLSRPHCLLFWLSLMWSLTHEDNSTGVGKRRR